MAKVVTTITIEPDVLKQIDHVAEKLDRSRSWILERAAKEALEDGLFESRAKGR